MGNPAIRVCDAFGEYEIGYDDVVKYHGRRYIAGVALGFLCLRIAFSELCPDGPADRSKVRFFSGMRGGGVRDAVEMIARCVSSGTYYMNTDAVRDDIAPPTPGAGRYYYEVSYGTRTVRLRLKHGLIPEEFYTLAVKDGAGAILPEELKRLQEIKETIAAYVMGHRPDEIFDYQVS